MNKVFVSYSRKDASWFQRLYEHLRPLAATGHFELWSDSDITPGESWRDAIQRSIESANAIILLISPDYLASEFIANLELPQLIEAAKARSVPIIPILIRPTAYQSLIGQPSVNPDGMALYDLSHDSQEEVLTSAAERIYKTLAQEAPSDEATTQSSDPHSRAFNIAGSTTGVSGSVNISGSGNIFVDAESKLKREAPDDDE